MVSSPTALKALHVYSASVSSRVTFRIVRLVLASGLSILYLSESTITVPDTDHSVTGSGRPLTVASKVTSVFKVVGRSDNGLTNVGRSKTIVISASHSVCPNSLAARTTYVPWSSVVASSMVKVTSRFSVTTRLKIYNILV